MSFYILMMPFFTALSVGIPKYAKIVGVKEITQLKNGRRT